MKEKILEFVNKLENKESKFYFYIPDSAGNITASVEYIYDVANVVQNMGYNSVLFHEKDTYVKPPFDEQKYENLDVVSFKNMSKSDKYLMSPADFIFIGEQYVNGFMPQFKKSKIVSTVVVISQLQDFIFSNLEVGESWDISHNIQNVLTTTENQATYLKSYMPTLNITVTPPIIGKEFFPPSKPKKPFVAILSRFQHDTDRLYKEFVLKFPMFSWIPFKTFGQMSKGNFANELSECMCAVWQDSPSSFGTFPLECMASKVPVIGVIPTVIPEWMVEDDKLAKNGLWVNSQLDLVGVLGQVIDRFLHNEDLSEIQDNNNTPKQYSEENFTDKITQFINTLTENKITQLKNIYENA